MFSFSYFRSLFDYKFLSRSLFAVTCVIRMDRRRFDLSSLDRVIKYRNGKGSIFLRKNTCCICCLQSNVTFYTSNFKGNWRLSMAWTKFGLAPVQTGQLVAWTGQCKSSVMVMVDKLVILPGRQPWCLVWLGLIGQKTMTLKTWLPWWLLLRTRTNSDFTLDLSVAFYLREKFLPSKFPIIIGKDWNWKIKSI